MSKHFLRSMVVVVGILITGPALAQTLCRVADPTPTPLNVRTSPNGRIVATLENGMLVSVLDRAVDGRGQPWVYVGRAEDRMPIGWVYRDFIDCRVPASPPRQSVSSCRVADPTPTPLNVRVSPNGRVVGRLENGMMVAVLDRATDRKGSVWAYVGRAEDRMPIGWVYVSYLDCRSLAASGDRTNRGNIPQPKTEESSGTGFFVSSNRIITNYHVVKSCNVITLTIPGMLSNSGRVIASDANSDLALVSLMGGSNNDTPTIPRLRSGVRVGENAFAYGYSLPGLLSSSENFTSGMVSSLTGLGDDIRRMQISAPVQPGNSGGPLLDRYGNIIGMVVSKLDAELVQALVGDIPQNVNFAIKASVIMSFLEAANVEIVAAGPIDNAAPVDPSEIAQKAKRFSVQVTCRFER